MSSVVPRGVRTRAHVGKRGRDAAVQQAIPGLPDDIVVTHILSHENLLRLDPADTARLRAVSRPMRDAVAATGFELKELDVKLALELGFVSALQRAHRQGRLNIPREHLSLCHDAAKRGQLEVLKWLRENDCPWDEQTCAAAAANGNLEMLKWLRTKGCPWDEDTCAAASGNGRLEILKWARAKGCPWDEQTCAGGGRWGYLRILRWARDNDCPEPDDYSGDEDDEDEVDDNKIYEALYYAQNPQDDYEAEDESWYDGFA